MRAKQTARKSTAGPGLPLPAYHPGLMTKRAKMVYDLKTSQFVTAEDVPQAKEPKKKKVPKEKVVLEKSDRVTRSSAKKPDSKPEGKKKSK